MNDTIEQFYDKYSEREKSYDLEHGSRLDYIINEFGLDKIHGENLADIGGGYGFLFKRLASDNTNAIFDGAKIEEKDLLCKSEIHLADLNTKFSMEKGRFDRSFCFEVIEHLENPYRCICEMKEMTKIGGLIYISVPDLCVTHNTPYPSLIYPHNNFEIFLGQMALKIKRYNKYNRPHHAHFWECVNEDWSESKMVFYKSEDKFRGKTPVEQTNL